MDTGALIKRFVDELAGPHVLVSVHKFDDLTELNFLERLHATA